MILPNKINQLAATDLSNADKLDIRLKLAELRKLEQVIHSTKRRYRLAHKPTKLARAPKIVGPKPPCKLCGRPTPHLKGPDGQYHMLAVKRRWMAKAAHAYWTKRGYGELVAFLHAGWRRLFIERRMVIFREVAPKTLALVGQDGAERIIDSLRYGVSRMPPSPERFRKWLKKRYA